MEAQSNNRSPESIPFIQNQESPQDNVPLLEDQRNALRGSVIQSILRMSEE